MSVTSDVSKLLSVWLNAFAFCRVKGRGRMNRSEVRAAGGGRARVRWLRRTSGVHGGEGPTQGLWGVRARAERTLNIPDMSVTLEVSKLLSGWLNADVNCAESERAHMHMHIQVHARACTCTGTCTCQHVHVHAPAHVHAHVTFAHVT